MTTHARSTAAIQHSAHFVVGFLSRPCCSIPAALALLGAGGTGIAAAFAPWRLWFMAAAGVFFAVSFYWNFIRNQNRAGMVVWGLSLALAIGIWVLPSVGTSTQVQPATVSLMQSEAMTTTTIGVRGMACQACARRIERGLKKLSGVQSAAVAFDAGEATVCYDPAQVSDASLVDCIRDLGFVVESVQPKETST